MFMVFMYPKIPWDLMGCQKPVLRFLGVSLGGVGILRVGKHTHALWRIRYAVRVYGTLELLTDGA